MSAPYRSLADLDLNFAKSGRRSAVRRERSVRRGRAGRISASALLVLAGCVAMWSVASEVVRGEDGPRAAPRVLGPERPSASPCPLPGQLRPAFASASRRTGVSSQLLVALAYEESNLRQDALSPAGAQGLLQLMPATARELELDPQLTYSNVLGGARYFDHMLKRFGRLELALAAYNAGPTTVDRAGRTVPPWVRGYVEAVKGRMSTLGGCS